jgi:5'-3' exonuclease
VADFIALRGDPSDKLPGARGVGPKGAASLLRQYSTLDDVLAGNHFPEQAEELRLFRRIAAMDPAAPIPSLDDQVPTWPTAAALARRWELNRLADRIEELAAA